MYSPQGRIDQAPHREGYIHQGGVHAEAIGWEGYVSGDVEEDELGKMAAIIITSSLPTPTSSPSAAF